MIWQGDVSFTELERARRFLGIRLPVELRRFRGSLRWVGLHRYRKGVHRIHIDGVRLSVEGANRIILHELAHAAQVELYEQPGDFEWVYRRQSSRRGYARNAFELEAREVSEALAGRFRIAR